MRPAGRSLKIPAFGYRFFIPTIAEAAGAYPNGMEKTCCEGNF